MKKPKRRSQAGRKKGRKSTRGYWSADVTRKSDALDLEKKLFTSNSPQKIAASLKRSAERSKRRKATPYQSAMSMLNFYINRAGKGLPARQKNILQRSKSELRKAFGRS